MNVDLNNLELSCGDQRIERVDVVKFLGLHMDENLNWSSHLKKIYTKLSKNLYLLRNVKKSIPNWAMKMLYYAYFHSHITYGLALWGPMCLKRDLKRITILQKKALRCIENTKYNSPTCPILKKHMILKIDDCIDLELSKMALKVSKTALPSPILDLFKVGTDYHNYNTRNRHNPVVAKHKSAIYNKSFLCKCPMLLSNLNDELKNCKTIHSFAKKFKEIQINKYRN